MGFGNSRFSVEANGPTPKAQGSQIMNHPALEDRAGEAHLTLVWG